MLLYLHGVAFECWKCHNLFSAFASSPQQRSQHPYTPGIGVHLMERRRKVHLRTLFFFFWEGVWKIFLFHGGLRSSFFCFFFFSLSGFEKCDRCVGYSAAQPGLQISQKRRLSPICMGERPAPAPKLGRMRGESPGVRRDPLRSEQ